MGFGSGLGTGESGIGEKGIAAVKWRDCVMSIVVDERKSYQRCFRFLPEILTEPRNF